MNYLTTLLAYFLLIGMLTSYRLTHPTPSPTFRTTPVVKIETATSAPTHPAASKLKNDFDRLIPVQQENKSGYIDNIDQTGRYVIEPQFDSATPFIDGIAIVSDGQKMLYINRAGTPVYESVIQ